MGGVRIWCTMIRVPIERVSGLLLGSPGLRVIYGPETCVSLVDTLWSTEICWMNLTPVHEFTSLPSLFSVAVSIIALFIHHVHALLICHTQDPPNVSQRLTDSKPSPLVTALRTIRSLLPRPAESSGRPTQTIEQPGSQHQRSFLALSFVFHAILCRFLLFVPPPHTTAQSAHQGQPRSRQLDVLPPRLRLRH
jgi:hypothetical protein